MKSYKINSTTSEEVLEKIHASGEKVHPLQCLTTSSVALIMDVGPQTWKRWVDEGFAPKADMTWNGQHRWKLSTIEKWLESNTQSARMEAYEKSPLYTAPDLLTERRRYRGSKSHG